MLADGRSEPDAVPRRAGATLSAALLPRLGGGAGVRLSRIVPGQGEA